MLAWLAASTAFAQDRPRFEQRWFYAQLNLQVEKSADELIGLLKRAGKAGYNGVVLADYKLNILERVPRHYFRNVARVKEAAAAAGIEIIPAVCPIGYSAGLLAHDPNLAEGLPVKEAPFVVKGREAGCLRRTRPGWSMAISRRSGVTASWGSPTRMTRANPPLPTATWSMAASSPAACRIRGRSIPTATAG